MAILWQKQFYTIDIVKWHKYERHQPQQHFVTYNSAGFYGNVINSSFMHPGDSFFQRILVTIVAKDWNIDHFNVDITF